MLFGTKRFCVGRWRNGMVPLGLQLIYRLIIDETCFISQIHGRRQIADCKA